MLLFSGRFFSVSLNPDLGLLFLDFVSRFSFFHRGKARRERGTKRGKGELLNVTGRQDKETTEVGDKETKSIRKTFFQPRLGELEWESPEVKKLRTRPPLPVRRGGAGGCPCAAAVVVAGGAAWCCWWCPSVLATAETWMELAAAAAEAAAGAEEEGAAAAAPAPPALGPEVESSSSLGGEGPPPAAAAAPLGRSAPSSSPLASSPPVPSPPKSPAATRARSLAGAVTCVGKRFFVS